MDWWTCDRRLYLTADGKRVVPEGDPAARWLWSIPGRRVPMAEAQRLGAVKAPKRRRGGQDKQAAGGEDKQGKGGQAKGGAGEAGDTGGAGRREW